MLQIIFFVILFSIAMLMSGEIGKSLTRGAEKMNEVMMKVVTLVMDFAPIGVFCLMAKTFSEQGMGLIFTDDWIFLYCRWVFITSCSWNIKFIIVYADSIKPDKIFQKMTSAQIFAFSTASSNATIPVTLQAVEKRMGVHNSIASFTVPFGATINMDGTAIMQGVARCLLLMFTV